MSKQEFRLSSKADGAAIAVGSSCWGVVAALIACMAIATAAVAPSPATAAQTRPFTGLAFGPDGVGGTESFEYIRSIATDGAGDVYVLDNYTSGSYKVYKFNASGNPVDFSSTNSNMIMSGGIQTNPPEASYQIAVAPASSPGGTGGNIYVSVGASEGIEPEVAVYSEAGTLLGTFGAPGSCGVATDAAGNIFVNGSGTISRYVPTNNPPTEADRTEASQSSSLSATCNLTVGGGNKLYATDRFGAGASSEPGIYELEGLSDPSPTKFTPDARTITANPATGELLADRGNEVASYASGGRLIGRFGVGQLQESYGAAIDPALDRAFIADNPSVFEAKVKVFGAAAVVPGVAVDAALTPRPSDATLRGSVNPEGLPVTRCVFEYGISGFENEKPCDSLPPTNSEPDLVTASISKLKTDGVTYVYRLVAENTNGAETSSEGMFTTAPSVVTEPATAVGEASATLHGKVFPTTGKYASCTFEYGLTSQMGFPNKAPCVPAAGSIGPAYEFHSVIAELNDLRPNDARYRFRLSATNEDEKGNPNVVTGGTLTFVTSGEPELTEVRASDANQESATLEGTIDPHGFGTEYRIEWGPTESYGQIATSGSLAPDAGPTKITARIAGLTAGMLYHFRVVATNRIGTATSLDRGVEALNVCGLPQGRCFELVSPRDAGPIALPGIRSNLGAEVGFQASITPGSLAYASESGYPGATRGGEILYGAKRGATGWVSTQVSPPITVRDETPPGQGERGSSSRTLALSPDLKCGVVESNQPLTPDPATRLVSESGGRNLYRRNPDGTYTAISELAPKNPRQPPEGSAAVYYHVVGISSDCSKVVFTSVYEYPGVGAVGEQRLYEWEQGSILSVGFADGTDTAIEAVAGGQSSLIGPNYLNAVSQDGSKVFFTEPSRRALLVRENGSHTRDISASETSVPDEGAYYQYATPDGSTVFFTANAGLARGTTGESGPCDPPGNPGEFEGCDLYEYDLAKSSSEHPLTDLSVAAGSENAEVVGVLGASEDGSHVYFAALGQLVPGAGLTATENAAEGTYSIYSEIAGKISFVATIGDSGGGNYKERNGALTNEPLELTSRVSQDGRYLLFESNIPVTAYRSGGAPEAYLYDAAASSENITCVSCRSDGRTSVASGNRSAQTYHPLASAYQSAVLSSPAEPISPPVSLIVSGGVPSVVFASADPLAPGATAAQTSLYEWVHGQVFLIAAEPADLQGLNRPVGEERYVTSLGASADGSDIYLSTPASLTAEDGDERSSVYDARIGGGFPQTPTASAPCNPTAEGSCQGPVAVPPATRGSGTATATGPGNRKHKKRKHRKKRTAKHRHHKHPHKHTRKSRTTQGRTGK